MARPYVSPYLTCEACNSINFIDLNNLNVELMPVCLNCQRSIDFRPGAKDYSKLIQQRQEESLEYSKRHERSIILVQRVYRGHAARIKLIAIRLEKERVERIRSNAARAIQRRVRGKIGRRIALVQMSLMVIETAHQMVLAKALRNTGQEARVFWYENEKEVEILIWDYRQFVLRTGGNPPIDVVEQNLMEIARRVMRYENKIVARVQALWRGVASRVVIEQLKLEKAKYREHDTGPAILIQRTFRRNLGWKRWKSFQFVSDDAGQLKNYVALAKLKDQERQRHKSHRELQQHYLQAHKKASCARITRALPNEGPVRKTMVSYLNACTNGPVAINRAKNHLDNTAAYLASLNGNRTNSSKFIQKFKDIRSLPRSNRRFPATYRDIIDDDDETDRS